MTDLRTAAQQALEALEIGYDSAQAEAHQFHAAMAGYKLQRHAAMDADVEKIARAITDLRAALAQKDEPTPPPEAVSEAEKTAYAAGWWAALAQIKGGGNLPPPLQAEPVQEPVARSLTEDERAAIEYFALNPSMAVLAFSHWLRRDKSAPLQRPAEPVQDPPEAMTERDHFDFARWHFRLGELADAYYAAGRTHPARSRSRADLMMHALDAATGWRARSALAAQEPVAWECREHGDSEWFDCGKESYGINPRRYTYRTLYTAPPKQAEPVEPVAQAVADERKRLLSIAQSIYDQEVRAVAHHARTWQAAHEWHMARQSGMADMLHWLRTNCP